MTPENLPENLGNFLNQKLRRMQLIHEDGSWRERLVDKFYGFTKESENGYADYALVFGTSFLNHPDKFKKRVYWGSMLWHMGRVRKIIFSGNGDDECKDSNQAGTAASMAVSDFGVDPEAVLVATGENNKNTQENVRAAKPFISNGQSVFVVSDNKHLIRGLTVAKHELGEGIEVFPHPVGGPSRLDPHDPNTVRELIKAAAYNRTFYKIPVGIESEVEEFLRKEVVNAVKFYENLLRDTIREKGIIEESFGSWFNNLPQGYRISKVQA